jgi:phosphoribosylamine---glycine ligase
MSKFRIISKSGDGLAIGKVLEDEGYNVDAYICESIDPKDKDSGSYKDLYDGLLDKVTNPVAGLERDDIILMDMTGIKYHTTQSEWDKIGKLEDDDHERFIELPTMGDVLRKQGYAVIGGGQINDLLELDREFGQDVAEEAGFECPQECTFNNYEDALAHVQSSDKRWVLKPSGGESYQVYPSKGPDDMAIYLQTLIDKKVKTGSVLMQEFVDGGVQMGIEGTWTGSKLVGFNSTFEHKRLMSNSTGPLTGETGSIIFYYPDETSKLVKYMKKLEPVLKKIGFPIGVIDCNFIITKEGPRFLEFTPRQGYPSTYIQLSACDLWGPTFEDQVSGKFSGYAVKNAKYFGGINCFIPEYPYGKTKKDYVESPTFFCRMGEEEVKKVQLIDAKCNKDGALITGGTYANLWCAVGQGETPKSVNDSIVKFIKEVEVYPLGYRSDIGMDLDDDIQNLKDWGYWCP